jgi:peptidoglycan glycosyltransferase
MMANVVREGSGTAAALEGIDVAGKTGTAEVDRPCGPNQGWFIAFAPRTNPKVAVAATVECTEGTGGVVAAPIAKQVMQELLR